MKQYIFENGQLVSVVDNRSLAEAISLNIEVNREKATQAIQAAGRPWHLFTRALRGH
jgi:hypothetical protein